LGIIACVSFAFWGAMFGTGNYGYAQKYVFDVSGVNLIKAVKDLKRENLTFGQSDTIYESDSFDTANSHFNVEMHLIKHDIAFCFFIQMDDRKLNSSDLYLVSVNKGTDFNDWKLVNRDLKRNEYLKVKRVFEEEILDKLKIKYE